MNWILAPLFLPLLSLATPQKVTAVIDDPSAQVVGTNNEATDCYSKQQALKLQFKVCQDHQTPTSCLDQFYPTFKKRFPKCTEEASAVCLEACVKAMTYSYCANYCR
jgi:hypothetical protein